MAAEAMAQKTDVSEIKDAVVRIRTLSADEKARELAYQRELALHEKATWEKNMKEAEEKTREAEERAEKAEKEKASVEKEKALQQQKFTDELRKLGYTDERIAEILGE